MTVRGGKHCLTGIVSLGEFHNALQGIKSGKKCIIVGTRVEVFIKVYYMVDMSFFKCIGESSVQLATHLLQFIFLSDGGFRSPLAHFPTSQCPPSVTYLQF